VVEAAESALLADKRYRTHTDTDTDVETDASVGTDTDVLFGGDLKVRRAIEASARTALPDVSRTIGAADWAQIAHELHTWGPPLFDVVPVGGDGGWASVLNDVEGGQAEETAIRPFVRTLAERSVQVYLRSALADEIPVGYRVRVDAIEDRVSSAPSPASQVTPSSAQSDSGALGLLLDQFVGRLDQFVTRLEHAAIPDAVEQFAYRRELSWSELVYMIRLIERAEQTRIALPTERFDVRQTDAPPVRTIDDLVETAFLGALRARVGAEFEGLTFDPETAELVVD